MLLLNLYNPLYWYNVYAQNLAAIMDPPKPVVEPELIVEEEDPQDFDSDEEDTE